MSERRDARRRNMMAHQVKREERFIIKDFAVGLMVVAFCFAITFIAILLARVATGTL